MRLGTLPIQLPEMTELAIFNVLKTSFSISLKLRTILKIKALAKRQPHRSNFFDSGCHNWHLQKSIYFKFQRVIGELTELVTRQLPDGTLCTWVTEKKKNTNLF